MSEQHENKAAKSVSDDTVISDTYQTTDSGFLSGEIYDSEESHIDQAEHIEETQIIEKIMQLPIDSGLDLADSFSGLDLKSLGYNDLSKGSVIIEEPPVESVHEDEAWKHYFDQNEDGNTLLHLAIAYNEIEHVSAFIRAAPRPILLDTPNDNAETALHLAVEYGQSQIVRWLVVAGAKLSSRNSQGDSPLHIAAENGDWNCCKAITDPIQANEREAMALASTQQPQQKVNFDQWNYIGRTCVHLAALGGHVEVLSQLVKSGANINAREGLQGYTALHYAISRGDERMINFLLSECSKLDVEVTNYAGRGPLQLDMAVSSPMAEQLRSRGAAFSPFSSEEEYSSDDEGDFEPNTNHQMFTHNLVNASA